MAEITSMSNGRKKGGRRSVKKSTRVDLTPMVDLGFLLITFFVFTTTLAQPTSMDLNVPKESTQEPSTVCESCALTLIPAGNDRLYYYEGLPGIGKIKETSYEASGLRNLLLRAKSKVIRVRGNDQLQLIIKPGAQSTLKNMVHIIDEAHICLVKRYYLDTITLQERHLTGQ